MSEKAIMVAKSLGTLCTFLFHTNFLFNTLLSFNKSDFAGSTNDHGKMSNSQKFQVCHRRNNIVLGRMKLRVRCRHKQVQWTMVLINSLVPRRLLVGILAPENLCDFLSKFSNYNPRVIRYCETCYYPEEKHLKETNHLSFPFLQS